MLFRTYRPKTARNVKAEQITAQKIEEIAASFNGSARVVKNQDEGILAIQIATLDGVVTATYNEWVVRSDDRIEIMSDVDFSEKYELARTTRSE